MRSDLFAQYRCGRAFLDETLDFVRIVFFFRAVFGQCGKGVGRIRGRGAGERRFEQSLCDQVGITTVGGSGVRIIRNRQTKVSNRLLSRFFDDIFPPAEELDHGERQIREVLWIGPLLFFQEAFQTLRGGVFRQIASEGGGQLHNPVPSMRCLNDTLDTRRTFRVQECSRGLIGGDHEVLDQQARTILPPGLQIHDFAVGQDRLQFGRMERERARIVSSLTK